MFDIITEREQMFMTVRTEAHMIEYQEKIITIIKGIKNIKYLKMLLGFAEELKRKEKNE